ncbi:hypothetical protein CP533_0720 [Ophiocordyceps camponoti-saundersi (nom. inval.)]|nr:hypothetical protein CP533_0720 [Ophiocordyceps camponoti-saundersi (nom. inval.)]
MSSDIQDGVFHCRPCNMAFYSWEALQQHKQEMRAAGRPSHIHCKHCGRDFKTVVSEIRHIHLMHPQDQKLVCRACGMGPFSRASGLIDHIEKGQCTKLSIDAIEQKREKKSEFARCLQLVSGSPEALMDGPLIAGLAAMTVKQQEQNLDKPLIAGLADKAPQYPHQRKQQDASLATDLTDKLVAKQQPQYPHQRKQQDAPLVTGLTDKPVAEQKQQDAPLVADKLVVEQRQPKAPHIPGPVDKPVVKQQLPSASTSATQPTSGTGQQPAQVFESMDRDHPDHPSFNSRRYYNTYAQAYVCPKLSCNKVFNKAGGLMAHLRSNAHAVKKYHCPYCNRRFPTMTAIVSHAEQSSARCHIRESDNYEAFMDHLTGGVIDVGMERHEDGTVKYDMGNVEW